MPRSGILGSPEPYRFFGSFAGISFWPGGLTLLAAAPGIGKTSWLLRMLSEASGSGIPAALGCYEHTPEELKYRLRLQATAAVGGAHRPVEDSHIETQLARCSEMVLESLSDQEDTVRAVEEVLIQDYCFPVHGPALLAMDYLQRIPVVGMTGMIDESQRAGEAAAALRALARRHGWAVIAAAALKADSFQGREDLDLSALLGDERVPYEADRVLLVWRDGNELDCGCIPLQVVTMKDRTGPAHTWKINFWGERFYPALPEDLARHG